MSDDRLKMGIVLKPQRFIPDKFVAAVTKPLVEAFISRYDTELIASQWDYYRYVGGIDFLVSLEPGWAAPQLNFCRRVLGVPTLTPPLSYIFMSDPHATRWRQRYFNRNRLDFVLAQYYHPTLLNLPAIPTSKLVHFPWAVPEKWIAGNQAVQCRNQDFLMCFGAGKGSAYDIRNWCKQQPFVRSSNHSRCEANAPLSSADYIRWLGDFDAVVAAGSSDPKYDLTVVKYFEIAASGALLFAQQTKDLERLGFQHMKNCVIFTPETFISRAKAYLQSPADYIPIREAGRKLILSRHTTECRLEYFDRHLRQQLAARGSSS